MALLGLDMIFLRSQLSYRLRTENNDGAASMFPIVRETERVDANPCSQKNKLRLGL